MGTFLRRVWYLFNRRRHERELVQEMHEHRELMHDPAKFGDTHRLLERSRDAWGWNWLDDAAQDFRLGVRGLMRSPAFSLTAVLILSFGIGLNLTLYQMANVVLLRPPRLSIRRPWRSSTAGRRGLELSRRALCAGAARRARQPRAVGRAARSLGAVAWGEELWVSWLRSFRRTGFPNSAARRHRGVCS